MSQMSILTTLIVITVISSLINFRLYAKYTMLMVIKQILGRTVINVAELLQLTLEECGVLVD